MNQKYRLLPAKNSPIRKTFEIEKPKCAGNQFNTNCPNKEGHHRGDIRPSLSVNLDKMVFHCFACDYEGKVNLNDKEIL
jgi:DNA primase